MDNLHEITDWSPHEARPHPGQATGQPAGFYDLDARNGLPSTLKEVVIHDIGQSGRTRAGPRRAAESRCRTEAGGRALDRGRNSGTGSTRRGGGALVSS